MPIVKFRSVPLEDATGKILGHNISGPAGRRVLRKGIPLTITDVATLRDLGHTTVYVAELETDDVDENHAAQRVATAVMGPHLQLSKALTGRANLHAQARGVWRVDVERLWQINLCEAITLATLPRNSVVQEGQMVATLKVIAYAIPEQVVREAESIGLGLQDKPLLYIDPFQPRRVSLILSGAPQTRTKIVTSFEKALRPRLESWGAALAYTDFVPLEDEADEHQLANLIDRHVADGMDMVILAGETAIMDRRDIAPRAVERAGGRVTCFGAPVDPGNLLMLARHGHVPIVGAPGCSRSPKANIIDLVLPRLLVGDYLTQLDIVKLGHGGLLEEVSERGRPRRLN